MKHLTLALLIAASNLIFAQGMLQNIDQQYSYLKLKKNGNSPQMRIYECLKNNCSPLLNQNEKVCFNFNPLSKKEVQLYYRSGFHLLHQKLIATMGLLIARHNPDTMLVGISNQEEFETTINTQLGNQLKMVSNEIPSIIGATNWVQKYNNIRFIGLFKEIITRPVTKVIQSKDAQGNVVEVFENVPADISCDK